MNSLEITTTLTLADWQAYQGAWAIRLQKHARTSRRTVAGTLLIAVLLAIALASLAAHLGELVPFAAIAIGAGVATLGLLIGVRRTQRAASPDENGAVLGPSRLRFDATGMHSQKQFSSVQHSWAVLQEVTLAPEHLFIWIDRVAALIVPLRDLPQDMTPQQATEMIRAFAADARAAESPLQAAAPALPADSGSARYSSVEQFASLQTFIAAIGRLLILRPVERSALTVSDTSIIAVAAFALGSWFVLDWLRAGPDSQFYLYGLVQLGWYASIVMLVAWLWSRLSEPHVEFRNTLAIAIAFMPVAMLLSVLTVDFIPAPAAMGVFTLVAIYATFYGHAGLRSLTSRHQPRAVFTVLLTLAVVAWFSQTQYVSAQFWYPNEEISDELPEEAEDYLQQWRQMEGVLFEQSERIDAAVAALDRPDDLPVASFFVGFAGMGEQRVFAGEIALAAKVIADRYDTADRSVRLVNDRRDLNAYPLASTTALRRTLAGVAQHMDLEQDVLFLALSSHGSEDGELSVSNNGIPVSNLSVDALAQALDESGIKWRVVIVSACFAGKFIEPLRDDYTIVITAAAADRSSFGCSDDRDLTYFGEAFYRDTLPTAPDLRTAFERTKAIIARREKEEDKEPSNPQAHFGSALERHLAQLESRSR